jgi:multiple sugar transport system permease protein
MARIYTVDHKINWKQLSFVISKWALLIVLAIFFLFPVYTMMLISVMPTENLNDVATLWPENGLQFGSYSAIFNAEYLLYLVNTLKVCFLNMGGVCIASSMCAFGLSKVKFKGSGVVFAIIMATVLLPGTVTSIPLYIIYTMLNWTNTLYPLWVPIWFGGGAMNIFLVRQFMKGIPNSYAEAALLDGASNFHIYWAIVLPLIRPIMIYLAVTTFFGGWNDFQGPLMYVPTEQSKWTLSLALYKNFVEPQGGTKPILANEQQAVGVMMMIPCVILFAFFQKELMEGIAAIGIKG